MNAQAAHFRFQMTKLRRTPGFWAPTIVFPAMLYSFFGASFPPEGITSQMAIGSFCVYGVLGVAFYQFGIGIAQDREAPFETWMRTLPGSSIPRAGAQAFSAVLIALVAVGMVIVASLFFAKTTLTLEMIARLLMACLIISVPASMMGIALGYLATGRTAPAIANLIFLPLAFLGGLWVPPAELPGVIAQISLWTPTRQMGELVWAAIGGHAPSPRSIVTLAGYSLLFVVLANSLAKRDRERRYA